MKCALNTNGKQEKQNSFLENSSSIIHKVVAVENIEFSHFNDSEETDDIVPKVVRAPKS